METKGQQEKEVERVSIESLLSYTPKQEAAHRAAMEHKFTLMGGAMGPGKSYWLRHEPLYWLLWWASQGLRGVRTALFCEDYPSLYERLVSKAKVEYPDWLGHFNEQRHEFTLRPDYGSGVIAFRNLDDPEKYKSAEFALIGVDEVNLNPLSTFNLLRTRLRWTGVARTKFIAACNPIGELWVRSKFVEGNHEPEEKEPHEFCFIPASVEDNPHVEASYLTTLDSLPEAERRAYKSGDWYAFEKVMDRKGFIRLITQTEYEAAIVGMGYHGSSKVIAGDPGGGGDESAAVLASSTLAQVLFNQKLEDTMQFAAILLELADKHGSTTLIVDAGGLGKGVYDRTVELTRNRPDFKVIGLQFGSKAEEAERFLNLRAEMYWAAREWILRGGKLYRDPAWAELLTVKYRVTDRKTEMQSKDDMRRSGIRSPNVADALAMAAYHVPSPTDEKFKALYKQRRTYDATADIWKS